MKTYHLTKTKKVSFQKYDQILEDIALEANRAEKKIDISKKVLRCNSWWELYGLICENNV